MGLAIATYDAGSAKVITLVLRLKQKSPDIGAILFEGSEFISIQPFRLLLQLVS